MILRVHLSNIVTIIKDENPGLDVSRLRNSFTFGNPKFYELERLGFSTYATPQTISLIDETSETYELPRGVVSELFKTYPKLTVNDKTATNPVKFSSSNIILKSFQKEPVEKLSKKNQGVVVGPPGIGKTVLGIETIISQAQKSLILVHTKDLAQQWRDRFQSFTDIEPGLIDSENYDVRDVTIGMVQSLNRPLEPSFTSKFGLVLLDEAHHAPAFTFQKLINQFPARYRYGLTATPERSDGLSFLLHATLGPVISVIQKDCLYLNGDIIKPRVKVIYTNFYMPDCRDYGQLLAAITKDDDRSHLILRFLQGEATVGHFCLVLSERISHIKKLHELFSGMCPDIHTACITSKNTKDQRNDAIKRMNQGNLSVLFATKIADEGLDIRRLDRLFLTCPVRSTNKVTQQIGRIQRAFPGKHDAVVYDFVDSLCGLAKSQFYSRRRKAYAGFEIKEIKYESENTKDASRDFRKAI